MLYTIQTLNGKVLPKNKHFNEMYIIKKQNYNSIIIVKKDLP
jgi:hypothetical protein